MLGLFLFSWWLNGTFSISGLENVFFLMARRLWPILVEFCFYAARQFDGMATCNNTYNVSMQKRNISAKSICNSDRREYSGSCLGCINLTLAFFPLLSN